MRLLKTEGSNSNHWQPQLVESRGEPYAILSHRWRANAHEEVRFSDIEFIDDGGVDLNTGVRQGNYLRNHHHCNISPYDKPGYQKLRGAARWAFSNGFAFLWVDTCCIDQTNSSEVSEAINSAWELYSRSSICYAYLDDIPSGYINPANLTRASLEYSQWWSRGWTLIELLAPVDVIFFSSDWNPIGYRSRLADIITAITRIDKEILLHQRDVTSISVAGRMSWAGHRRTSRVEDVAYSIMGLFNVNMPILYGEGDKAFLRLQQEIIKISDDESIFAWIYPAANPDHRSGLLARHPSAFANTGNIAPFSMDSEDREPYAMTNRGLSIKLPLSPTQDGLHVAALHCPALQGQNGFLAIYLKKVNNEGQHYVRIKCDRLTAVTKRGTSRKIYVKAPVQQLRPDSSIRPRSLQPLIAVPSHSGSPTISSARPENDYFSISEVSRLEVVEREPSNNRTSLWHRLGRTK